MSSSDCDTSKEVYATSEEELPHTAAPKNGRLSEIFIGFKRQLNNKLWEVERRESLVCQIRVEFVKSLTYITPDYVLMLETFISRVYFKARSDSAAPITIER